MQHPEPEDLTLLKASDLISRLESGNLSLLKVFKANRLRTKMKPVGLICRFILWLIFLGYTGNDTPARNLRRRKFTYRILHFFFPDKYLGKMPNITGGAVIGFNHPTLHEILSLIAWALYHFPEKDNYFPVNLPWYEVLASRAHKLRMLGICITPLITAATQNKIHKACKNDADTMAIVGKIRQKFLNHYAAMASEFSSKQNNTFAAPSATRQATIFPSFASFVQDPDGDKLPVAMSYLALAIARKDKDSSVVFLPLTIIPPRRHTRGLNLFRRYLIKIGSPTPMQVAHEHIKEKDFEHYFLMQLTKEAPESLWYPAVTI
jgi:hypothetical protein